MLLCLGSASVDSYRASSFLFTAADYFLSALLFYQGAGPRWGTDLPCLIDGDLELMVTQLQGGFITSHHPHFGRTPEAGHPSWHLRPAWSLAKQLTNPAGESRFPSHPA